MLHKTFPATVKAGGEGKVEAYVSAFRTTPDAQGDIVRPGAFTKSIASGRTFKMFFNHNAETLPVGVWDHAAEDGTGLKMRGHLLMGTQAGRETYEALKEGAVSDFSIGYQVVRSTQDQKSGTRYLDEIDLFEASPVNFPADDQAVLVGVKAAASAASHLACKCSRAAQIKRTAALVQVVRQVLEARERNIELEAKRQALVASHQQTVGRTTDTRRREARRHVYSQPQPID